MFRSPVLLLVAGFLLFAISGLFVSEAVAVATQTGLSSSIGANCPGSCSTILGTCNSVTGGPGKACVDSAFGSCGQGTACEGTLGSSTVVCPCSLPPGSC